MTMLDRALYLESLGLSIFPLAPRSKRPAGEWKESQTTRAPHEQILSWWGNGSEQNIAVACGPVSGVFVVDIDGPEGEALLATLEAEHGALPKTWRVKTARGRHYWFKDPGIRNTAGKIGAKIDTRGEGGYVAAPGSVHPDGPIYDWELGFDPEFTELADLPKWISDRLQAKPDRAAALEPVTAKVLDFNKAQRQAVDNREFYRVQQYLQAMIAGAERDLGGMLEGARNQTLNDKAMWLGHFGHYGVFDQDQAWLALSSACMRNGLMAEDGQRACQATFLSGWKAGAAAPREIPEGDRPQPQSLGAAATPKFDPETGEILEDAPADDPEDEPFPASSLIGRPPEREWIVPDWLPAGHVTSLYGDGGTGKSLVAMLLANCIATGQPWFGLEVKQSAVMGVFAEENRDEIWRRQFDIEALYGPTLRSPLDGLHLWPRAGKDNILEMFDAKRAISILTPFYQKLESRIAVIKPKVLVLDTLADMFGGDEIVRVQVNHFIKATLGAFCARYACTVLLVAHPSRDGMATNRGDGGSTAWNNSVRSRWYLTKPETAVDQNSRVLTRMKANYAKAGPDQKIEMTWVAGTFQTASVQVDRLPPDMIKDLLTKINEAFDSGNPFGSSHNARRPLVPWMMQTYELKRDQAKTWQAAWISSGVLVTERVGRASQKEGLRVAKWPS